MSSGGTRSAAPRAESHGQSGDELGGDGQRQPWAACCEAVWMRSE